MAGPGAHEGLRPKNGSEANLGRVGAVYEPPQRQVGFSSRSSCGFLDKVRQISPCRVSYELLQFSVRTRRRRPACPRWQVTVDRTRRPTKWIAAWLRKESHGRDRKQATGPLRRFVRRSRGGSTAAPFQASSESLPERIAGPVFLPGQSGLG